jgi:hypothetical protein
MMLPPLVFSAETIQHKHRVHRHLTCIVSKLCVLQCTLCSSLAYNSLSTKKVSWAVFTTLHFLHYSRIITLSSSVFDWQVIPAHCNVTL